ncbi:hypothetical protein [Roseomonas sp. HF4]|uniref:hypothetical protein n=1 Tax=Roseomonas sp. HF4 TaxID=2562313 RepID=UPI0010BF8055|nr:hypothetical protein [Roseomonas sp. HF4]
MEDEPPKCGVIMPISAIDGCTAEHWIEVKTIIFEAIKAANFVPNLVSDADDIGVIQRRIIQNIFDNEMCVCDVSGKNPNVMFELGMRLAFDKPVIIIKDNKTDYSFDTSPIEHVSYPRDLRFAQILSFKEALRGKISATYEKAKSDPKFTSFLKHFGEFEVAKIDKREVSGQDFLIEKINLLSEDMRTFQRHVRTEIRRSYLSEPRSAIERSRRTFEPPGSSRPIDLQPEKGESALEFIHIPNDRLRHMNAKEIPEKAFLVQLLDGIEGVKVNQTPNGVMIAITGDIDADGNRQKIKEIFGDEPTPF